MIEETEIDPSGPMTDEENETLRQHAFKMATDLAGDWRDFLGPNFPAAAEGALDAWAMAFCHLSTHEEAAKLLELKANILRLLGHKQKGEAH